MTASVRTTAAPSAPASTPATTAPGGQASAPRCHASQLSMAFTGLNAAMGGQRGMTLILTNHSGSTCYVYGYPGLAFYSGSRIPLSTHLTWLREPRSKVVLRPGGNAQALLTWRVNMDPPTPFNPAIVHITSPDEHAYLRGDVPGHPLASSLPPAGRGKNVTASRRMPPPGIHLEKQALARFRHPRMPGPAAGAAHGYHRWNRYADASVFPR